MTSWKPNRVATEMQMMPQSKKAHTSISAAFFDPSKPAAYVPKRIPGMPPTVMSERVHATKRIGPRTMTRWVFGMLALQIMRKHIWNSALTDRDARYMSEEKAKGKKKTSDNRGIAITGKDSVGFLAKSQKRAITETESTMNHIGARFSQIENENWEETLLLM